MMRMFKNKKAQNTAEYAILIALVIAAAMAIQTYVKRGLQAKVRDAVISYTSDPDVATLGDTAQYEPYYLDTAFTTKTDSTQNVNEELEGGWIRDSITDVTERDGTQTNTAPIDGG
ncbi:MAG: hypothetical protein MJA29_06875 [Candidatus Omnitrophica bacterium]|nr:hypothetical protein [Candidatus Omnitrophota bacterium]